MITKYTDLSDEGVFPSKKCCVIVCWWWL